MRDPVRLQETYYLSGWVTLPSACVCPCCFPPRPQRPAPGLGSRPLRCARGRRLLPDAAFSLRRQPRSTVSPGSRGDDRAAEGPAWAPRAALSRAVSGPGRGCSLDPRRWRARRSAPSRQGAASQRLPRRRLWVRFAKPVRPSVLRHLETARPPSAGTGLALRTRQAHHTLVSGARSVPAQLPSLTRPPPPHHWLGLSASATSRLLCPPRGCWWPVGTGGSWKR